MLIVVGFALFFFIGISAMLARALAATGNERSRVLEVAEAQARGDTRAVLSATCRNDGSFARTPGCFATSSRNTFGSRAHGYIKTMRHASFLSRRRLYPIAWDF